MNDKPKANDKGKENANVRTSHVLGNVSNSAANHSAFNQVTKSLGKFERRFN